jgi:protein O-GlcNAc transferase
MSSIPEAFQIAQAHHLAGRLPEAEAIYQQILGAEPQHAQALHCLGVIAHQNGKNDVALGLIQQAVALDPHDPTFRNNLGEAFRLSGRFAEAIPQYEKAIALKPDYAESYLNWGKPCNCDLITQRLSMNCCVYIERCPAGISR